MKTKYDQEIGDLAQEFIAGMRKLESGSESGNLLFAKMLETERTDPNNALVIQSVQRLANSPANGYECDFLVRCKPRVTNVFLSYCALQVGQIPDAFETMVGLYCTAFYQTHKRTEELTLRWVGETIGKCKVVNFQMMWPWFKSSVNSMGISIFKVMTPEDLYVGDKVVASGVTHE